MQNETKCDIHNTSAFEYKKIKIKISKHIFFFKFKRVRSASRCLLYYNDAASCIVYLGILKCNQWRAATSNKLGVPDAARAPTPQKCTLWPNV